MKNINIKNINKNSKNNRLKKACALVLAAVMVSMTAITGNVSGVFAKDPDAEPICGIPEHTHGSECYETDRTLACGLEEGEIHTHDAGCYETERSLICGENEAPAHTHTDDCYTVTEELMCGEEESDEHTHTSDCYTERRELTCGQEESEGHTHTDACYEEHEKLVCGLEEGIPHEHTDSCYTETTDLICGLQEHAHTDACYAEAEIPEDNVEETAASDDADINISDRTVTDKDGNVSVKGELPEGITVTAKKVSADIVKLFTLPEGRIECAYDITLWLDGEEYQSETPVSVQILNTGIDTDKELKIAHIENNAAIKSQDRDQNTQELRGTVDNDGTVEFTTESFSLFIILSSDVTQVIFDLAKGDVSFTDDGYDGYDADGKALNGNFQENEKYIIRQDIPTGSSTEATSTSYENDGTKKTATSHTVSIGTEDKAVTKDIAVYLDGVNIDAPGQGWAADKIHKPAVYVNTSSDTVNLVLSDGSVNQAVAYSAAHNVSDPEKGSYTDDASYTHAAIEKEIKTEGRLRIICEEGYALNAGHECKDSGKNCGKLIATALSDGTTYINGAGIGSKGYIGDNTFYKNDESTSGTLYNLDISGGIIEATGAGGSGNGGGPGIGISQTGPNSQAVGYNAKGLVINGGSITARSGNGSAACIGGGFHSGYIELEINGGYITTLRGKDYWPIDDKRKEGSVDVAAAIGGGGGGSSTSAFYGATVTITGGTIDASAAYGAAIGSSAGGSNGSGAPANVIITGGNITASTSEGYGAAIGAGGSTGIDSNYKGLGGEATVNISGGNITASAEQGADIGGGGTQSQNPTNSGGDADVTISGGEIHAMKNGIGGGNASAGKGGDASVNISGGELYCASIGGGDSVTGTPGSVTGTDDNAGVIISNGTVKAGSIGGGKSNNGESIGFATVKITGGNVQGQFILANSDTSKKCSFEMTGGTIDNSGFDSTQYTRVQENGGAVYLTDPNGVIDISGGDIKNCTGTRGGAIYMAGRNGQLKMTGGTISDCNALDGGGIYQMNGSIEISGKASVLNNTASMNGGGAYISDGKVRMFGGSFTGNTATSNGGGMCVSSQAQAADVVIRSGELSKNRSGTNTSSDASGSPAAGNGGAIAVISESGTADTSDKVIIGLLEEHEGLNLSDHTFDAFEYTETLDNEKSTTTASENVSQANDTEESLTSAADTDITAEATRTHSACPEITGNTAEGNGGGIYMSSSVATLDIYCLNESDNSSAADSNGGSIMANGGTVNIGDKQHNDDKARGNISISSSMLVSGGNVEISGNMDNPYFKGDILVDIRNNTGTFKDNRQSATTGDETGSTEIQDYKIHYFENFKDANGVASGAYKVLQYDKDVTIKVQGALFSHEGYKLMGWSKDQDATEATYKIGSEIANKDDHKAWGDNPGNSLILYAVWEKITYTVKFAPNKPAAADSYTGEMGNQKFTYGEMLALTSNSYKITGYVFTEWNTQEDGNGSSYADGYSESKISNEDGATVTLYAQWKACDIDSGESGGGSTEDNDPLSYAVSDDGRTITESCECGGHVVSVTMIVSDSYYYDSKAHGVTLEYSPSDKQFKADVNVTYYMHDNNGQYTAIDNNNVPVEVGSYKVSVKAGDKEISAEYKIVSPKDGFSVEAKAVAGQVFKDFADTGSLAVYNNDAFTVQFTAITGNEANVDAYKSSVPVLSFDKALPSGTSIIMQELKDADDQNYNYYFYKLSAQDNENGSSSSGTEITISEFTCMGGSAKYTYENKLELNKKQLYRFIVDFSNVKSDACLSSGTSLKAEFTYKYIDQSENEEQDDSLISTSSNVNDVSASLIVSLKTASEFSLSQADSVLRIVTPDASANGRWAGKSLVLTASPSANATAEIPSDAALTVVSGSGDSQKTQIYKLDASGKFIVPLTWATSQDITLSLSSDTVSSKGKTYDLALSLGVGQESSSATQSAPAAYEHTTEASVGISLTVPKDTSPSLRIKGDKHLFSLSSKNNSSDSASLDATVEWQNADNCVIGAIIEKKGAGSDGGYGGKLLDTTVAENNKQNSFSLGGITESGSYRLLVTVSNKNGQTLLTVPYYFIVQ